MEELYLSGKNSNKKILIDKEDYDIVSKYKWYLGAKGYAKCNFYKEGKRTSVRVHRLIMNFPDKQIDHINNNKLDNRRKNLRLVNNTQNQQNKGLQKNKTLPKGVSTDPRNPNKFRVRISVNGKSIYLGYTDCVLKAEKMYNEAAKKYFKQFSYLNNGE